MKILAKIIRVLTIPPIMAIWLLTTLFVVKPEFFGTTALYLLAVFFIALFPILAYPLQPITPVFKHKGREGQRTLAMIFSVSGYLLGCITNLFMNAPKSLWTVYLVYLLSGIGVAVFNKLFRLRASGHACGIMGPVAFLFYSGIGTAFVGIAIYFAALWASVKMKRHTLLQFIGGAAIPVAALIFVAIVFKFI